MKQQQFPHQHDANKAYYCLAVFGIAFLALFFLSASLQTNTVLFFMILYFDGFLAATYLEYHHHRFWAHRRSYDSGKLVFSRHKNHHIHPGDIRVTRSQRIIMSIICLACLVVAIKLNNYFTLLAGFVFGAAYSFISHWMLHQRWITRIFPRLLRFHMYHHSKSPNTCFGVSCPWWDIIFSTSPPKQVQLTNKISDLYFSKDKLVVID